MDKEKAYVNGLIHYINGQADNPYLADGFSEFSQGTLNGVDSKINDYDMILISEKALERIPANISQDRIVLLVESDLSEKYQGYFWFYKYQSALKMIQYIEESHKKKIIGKYVIHNLDEDKMVILFASPIGRSCKTTVALRLANNLTNKKVLFISLEVFSDIQQRLHTDNKTGMTEVIYYLKQHDECLYNKVQGMIEKGIEFDCLFPVRYPKDYFEVTEDEWIYLIQCLKRESPYQMIIIDTSHFFPGIYAIFSESDLVAVPYVHKKQDEVKLDAFISGLESETNCSMKQKIMLIEGGSESEICQLIKTVNRA